MGPQSCVRSPPASPLPNLWQKHGSLKEKIEGETEPASRYSVISRQKKSALLSWTDVWVLPAQTCLPRCSQKALRLYSHWRVSSISPHLDEADNYGNSQTFPVQEAMNLWHLVLVFV